MDYNVRILPSAEKEVAEAVALLAGYSKNAARSLLDELENQLDLLRRKTISYAYFRMPELAHMGYRSALVGDCLFLYYIEENDLVIAHFFHQRQGYVSLVVCEPPQ